SAVVSVVFTPSIASCGRGVPEGGAFVSELPQWARAAPARVSAASSATESGRTAKRRGMRQLLLRARIEHGGGARSRGARGLPSGTPTGSHKSGNEERLIAACSLS